MKNPNHVINIEITSIDKLVLYHKAKNPKYDKGLAMCGSVPKPLKSKNVSSKWTVFPNWWINVKTKHALLLQTKRCFIYIFTNVLIYGFAWGKKDDFSF